MKVLVSAGLKTGNIVSTVKRKYSKGSVEIFSKLYITLIASMFEQGNYFDRAVILEEGLEANDTKDLALIHKNVSDFVKLVLEKCSGDVTIIWVVTSVEMAKLISEETLELYGRNLVLIRNPQEKLVTSFFVNIISNPIDSIHPELAFKVTDIKGEAEKVKEFSDVSDKDVLTKVDDVDITKMVITAEETQPKETAIGLDDILGITMDEDKADNTWGIHKEEQESSSRESNESHTVPDNTDVVNTKNYISKNESDINSDQFNTLIQDNVLPNGVNLGFDIEQDSIAETSDKLPIESGAEETRDNIKGTKTDDMFNVTLEQDTSDYKESPTDMKGIFVESTAQENEAMDSEPLNHSEEAETISLEKEEFNKPLQPNDSDIPSGNEALNKGEGLTVDLQDMLMPEEKEIDSMVKDVTFESDMQDDVKDTEGVAETVTDSYSNLFAETKNTETVGDTPTAQEEVAVGDYSNLFSFSDNGYDTVNLQEEETDFDIQSDTEDVLGNDIESLFIDTMYESDTSDETDDSADKYADDFTGIDSTEAEESTGRAVTNNPDDLFNKEAETPSANESLIKLFSDLEDADISEVTEEAEPVVVKKKGLFSRLFQSKKSVVTIEDMLSRFLDSYRGRGSSIVVTGSDCSGKTTIAANLANIISRLGYSVLLVDMDTKGRGLSAITKLNYDAIHSVDTYNPCLKQALNTTYNEIGKFITVVTPTLHLLGMGLAADIVMGDRLAPRSRLSRFINSTRTHYCVTVFDLPIDLAGDYASDIVVSSEHIIIASEYSNYGALNLMLDLANIEMEEVESVLFNRGQLCLTKVIDTKLKSILGRVTHSVPDYLKCVDKELNGLLGEIPHCSFSDLRICGSIPYDARNDALWYSNKLISDTSEGWELYVNLLHSVILKR